MFHTQNDIVWYDCDMVIGIDASRAFGSAKTGTENYSYHLITSMLRLPESRPHTFVLFIRPNTIVPSEIDGYSNVFIKTVNFKYLWTQVGLAWETWRDQVHQNSGTPVLQREDTGKHKLDVLWIPAHTIPILRRPTVKTVVTIHGLEYKWLKEYKNRLQRWYLPLTTYYSAKSATQLIAVSEFTKQQLKKEVHNITKDIKVIYEGAQFATASSVQGSRKFLAKHSLEKMRYILFVGTIQPRKNLVALIQAFSKMINADPDMDYKLVIAGSVGWLAEETLRAPSEYGIQERVVFTGRVDEDELRELYQQAKLYVQPSLTEGFGLPVLEAMREGVPVISSDGGALREVVGDAGIVVPLKNGFVAKLAAEMQRLMKSPKLSQKLGEKGRVRASQFGWEIAAKKTLKLLHTTGQ